MNDQIAKEIFGRALRLHRQGEAQQAEQLYRQTLELSPDYAEAHNNLGILLRTQGKLEESLACFLAALRVNRQNPHFYVNFANLLVDMKWPHEAAFAYGRAADLMRKRGDWADAVQYCERALATGVSELSTRLTLGMSLLRLNRPAEAWAQFSRILTSAGDLAGYSRFVADGGSVAEVSIDGRKLRFRVGAAPTNIGVDLCHANGRLYEQAELTYCRTKVGPRAAIVDVGANTGNHLVYFAKFLDPTVIIPVEFHPEAISQLRENIGLNEITCVDERCLGVGASDRHASLSLVDDVDWAQARLAASGSGTVKVAPLDDLVAVPVGFMKIDVEGMEIEVLKGARKLISANRPSLLIEVQDENVEVFGALVRELNYVLDMKFGHDGYSNYFLVPGA